MPIDQYYAFLRKHGYTLHKRLPGDPGGLLMQGPEPGEFIRVPAPEGLAFDDRLQALKDAGFDL